MAARFSACQKAKTGSLEAAGFSAKPMGEGIGSYKSHFSERRPTASVLHVIATVGDLLRT